MPLQPENGIGTGSYRFPSVVFRVVVSGAYQPGGYALSSQGGRDECPADVQRAVAYAVMEFGRSLFRLRPKRAGLQIVFYVHGMIFYTDKSKH